MSEVSGAGSHRRADGGASSIKTKKSIFIVDDHPVVRIGIRELIAGQDDLDVCGEATGDHDVISTLRSLHPDVIILDLRLPQGNGLALLKQISRLHPQSHILVHSMQDSRLFAGRAIEAGAKGFVDKANEPNELLNAIRTVLRGEVYGCPSLTGSNGESGEATGTLANPAELLTNRELEVLTMIGEGRKTREIAEACNLSVKTVETHREKIKRKLGITSTPELVRFAVQWVLESEH